jgi:hypothetical protein
MSKFGDLDVLASAARRVGLSRREFLERAAQAGIVAGAGGFRLPSVFAQSPSTPGKPDFTTGASTFIAAPGFSVSGAIGGGNTLTLTKSGGGFGTKPNGAKPLYWWPFETDANPSSLSRNPTNPPTDATNGALSQAVVPAGSLSAWCFDLINPVASRTFLGVPFTSDSLYVWVKRYYDFDFSTLPPFNLKPFRLWAAGTNVPDVYYGLQGAEETTGNPRYMAEMTETYSRWGGHPFVPRTWRIEEWMYAAGSLDTTDGQLHHVMQGRYAFTPSLRWCFRTTAYPNKYAIQFLDQLSNATPLTTAPAYLDAYYVDDSWCRVLISDEPSWQVATQPSGTSYSREIQIPTAWSDTSISFVLRQGSHASLVGKHLYVIGAGGTPVNVGAFA